MEVINPGYYLLISAALFSIGLAIVVIKRHAIMVLMGIELMLNAVNLNLIAFSQYDPDRLQGQMLALFVMIVAAAEAAVALAIILQVHKHFRTVQLDEISEMKK
ncbi:NADH-quinone oxidoreductase subunit NuoK [Tellurirhabdus rosea]|uniref:NADH-quinone oxidoreductase subunit NuoK n=1 Tax=Tellurirhabdus rosea TaxID=2674997 RepID=UPI002B1CAF04|nr:NADH-quinone oxidoreductase subunit NuoK [Tellurirhabdus rosea]